MKHATMDMLYVATDFIFANTTYAEREVIFCETARGRIEDKGLTDNDHQLYFSKKMAKKILKKISKTY